MSTAATVIMVLSFVLGLINQGVSQGSILGGLVKIPPSWLPYLTVAASFLGGFVQSISGVSPITGQAIMAAIMAGLLALSSAGGGAAVAHHLGTPKRMKMGRNPAPPANDTKPADAPKAA
jgi:hypothetical protein